MKARDVVLVLVLGTVATGCALVSPQPARIVEAASCPYGVKRVETYDTFDQFILFKSKRSTAVECAPQPPRPDDVIDYNGRPTKEKEMQL